MRIVVWSRTPTRLFIGALACAGLLAPPSLVAAAEKAKAPKAQAAKAEPKPEPKPDPSSKGASAGKADGGKRARVHTFTGLDVEGKLKTPQLLYFRSRMKQELDTSTPERRSFMPELGATANAPGL
jgi:hypothetical protein